MTGNHYSIGNVQRIKSQNVTLKEDFITFYVTSTDANVLLGIHVLILDLLPGSRVLAACSSPWMGYLQTSNVTVTTTS